MDRPGKLEHVTYPDYLAKCEIFADSTVAFPTADIIVCTMMRKAVKG